MKQKHTRILKHLILITSLRLGASWLLHTFIAPNPSTHQAFNLEQELQALPEDQRDAARTQWETLTEAEQQQAQKAIQSLSEDQKQQAIKQLQKETK